MDAPTTYGTVKLDRRTVTDALAAGTDPADLARTALESTGTRIPDNARMIESRTYAGTRRYTWIEPRQ